MTRYGFSSVLGAFFHAPTQALREQLPTGLRPLESHPGLGVLALTMFDFDASEVGAYREFVASIVVVPHAPRGEPLPHSSFFPIMLATTTQASRAHASERWHLPQLESCANIEREQQGSRQRVRLGLDGRQLLSLAIEAGAPSPSARLYQCFSSDARSLYRVAITIEGGLAEHEDERGELELGEHPRARMLAKLIGDPVPFREQVMNSGEQRFAELTHHTELHRTA